MELPKAVPHIFEDSLNIRGSDGHYEHVVVPAWEGQPGLVYGGFTLATVVRAAGLECAAGRPASITCQFLRPLAVEELIQIEVTALRRGRSSDLLRVSLIQSEKLAVEGLVRTTTATVGPTCASEPSRDLGEPTSFRLVRELQDDDGWERRSNFQDHTEIRADWDLQQSDHFGWIRFEDGLVFGDPFLEAARIAFLLDQQAPAILNHLGYLTDHGRRELPWYFTNLDLLVHFHKSHGTDWLCYISKVTDGYGGVVSAQTQAWSRERELLATAHSQVAFFPTQG